MNKPSRQTGVALITALVIIALGSVLATNIVWDTHIDQRRASNLLSADQALQYALGAEDWVSHIMRRDDTKIDFLGEDWATELPPLPVEGGQITGRVSDLQGRFNINNLLNDEGAIRPEEKTRLTRLLSLLSLEPNLADTIADWLDADIDPTGFGGAEDGIYLRKSPAYRAANRALASITELRLVEGMTPEAFDALAQHVAALPTYTKVNINTATAEVIMSLNEGITANDVQSIISERDQGTFDSVTALQAFQANLSGSVPLGAVSVNSNYFLLESYATIGTASISLYSVLVRDNDSAATQILSRYIGTL